MCEFEVAIIGLLGTILGTIITVAVSLIISKKDRINQFRLAALEKRLAVHQEAFSLWTELFWNLREDKLGDIVLKSQDWWYKNCLYLDSKSRNAFKKALNLSVNFKHISDSKLIEKQFREIEQVGELLVAGVELPSIGKNEGKRVEV